MVQNIRVPDVLPGTSTEGLQRLDRMASREGRKGETLNAIREELR